MPLRASTSPVPRYATSTSAPCVPGSWKRQPAFSIVSRQRPGALSIAPLTSAFASTRSHVPARSAGGGGVAATRAFVVAVARRPSVETVSTVKRWTPAESHEVTRKLPSLPYVYGGFCSLHRSTPSIENATLRTSAAGKLGMASQRIRCGSTGLAPRVDRTVKVASAVAEPAYESTTAAATATAAQATSDAPRATRPACTRASIAFVICGLLNRLASTLPRSVPAAATRSLSACCRSVRASALKGACQLVRARSPLGERWPSRTRRAGSSGASGWGR
jgi:hypothetical protein